MKPVMLAVVAAWLGVGCVDQMTEPVQAPAPAKTATRRFGVFDPIEVPSTSSDVRVFDGDEAECESEALGVVDSSEPDRARAIEMMRTRAAALGAEAVTAVQRLGARWTATAVRCRDLRDGRAYDVIEDIDVPVKDGGEEAAFDALRSRAYDLAADLVIDITTEAGHVKGKAIRYK